MAGSSNNRIYQYTINTTTGELTEASSDYSRGFFPQGVKVHRDGDFLITHHGTTSSSGIFNFPVTASGAMGTSTSVTHSLGAGARVYDFAFHPTLDVAYAIGYSTAKITMFTVDRTLNTVTETGTPLTMTGTFPMDIAIDPTGKVLLVANNGSDQISVFNIDSTTGVLTAASTPTYTVGDSPQTIVFASH